MEEEQFFRLYFEIEFLKAVQYHGNPVQHLINGTAEDTDIIEVEQERQVLLIPKAHLHEATKTGTHVG